MGKVPTGSTTQEEPNPELLRREGWSIKAAYGVYCVVWRGSDEVVMVWKNQHWERASGGSYQEAA
jgi:hypothetical protein